VTVAFRAILRYHFAGPACCSPWRRLRPSANQDGLAEARKEHVKDKIGKWKHPRWIAIITELPKTAVEKSSVSS
jgi:acyl-CoA synthetase (AMP-forming)/AMP-acid ligase II